MPSPSPQALPCPTPPDPTLSFFNPTPLQTSSYPYSPPCYTTPCMSNDYHLLLQRMVQQKNQQVQQHHRRTARLDTQHPNLDPAVPQMPWRLSWTVLLSPPAGMHTASLGTAADQQQGCMHRHRPSLLDTAGHTAAVVSSMCLRSVTCCDCVAL